MIFYNGKFICDILWRIVRTKSNITVLFVESKYRIEFYNVIFFGHLAFSSRHVIYFYGVNEVVSQWWNYMWQSQKKFPNPMQDYCVNRRFEWSNLNIQFRLIFTFMSKIQELFYIFGCQRRCFRTLCFSSTFSEELTEFNLQLLCWLSVWNIESNYTIPFF